MPSGVQWLAAPSRRISNEGSNACTSVSPASGEVERALRTAISTRDRGAGLRLSLAERDESGVEDAPAAVADA